MRSVDNKQRGKYSAMARAASTLPTFYTPTDIVDVGEIERKEETQTKEIKKSEVTVEKPNGIHIPSLHSTEYKKRSEQLDYRPDKKTMKFSSSSPHLPDIGKAFFANGLTAVRKDRIASEDVRKVLAPPPSVGFSRCMPTPASLGSLNHPSSIPLSHVPSTTGGGQCPGFSTPPQHIGHMGGQSPDNQHRGQLSMSEKYNYDLSKAQLKASSRTSALLSGFAMVALVELQYDQTTPPALLIILGIVTTLLVSVHLLALMMSTCILPYMEANGCTQDSPHIRLKFYIDLSWLFSTCIGLILFLVEIGVIFFVKFYGVKFLPAAYMTTAMLIPVVCVFVIFSYLIHKNRANHSLERIKDKVADLNEFFDAEQGLTPMPKLAPVQQI